MPKPGWSQLQQSEFSDKDFYTENISLVFNPKWNVAMNLHQTEYVWVKFSEAVSCMRKLDELEVTASS